MKHLYILIFFITFLIPSVLNAQEDDMYFISKKEKKEKVNKASNPVSTVAVIYTTEEQVPVVQTQHKTVLRDVDEYNRRGKYSFYSDSLNSDTLLISEAIIQTSQSQNLYELGYTDGYSQGFSDGEDLDYYYGLRLARFHSRHFYDPWYWNNITYVYDPWHWDPWYWDPWYSPYYHSGWYSVGWGVSHWGSYWNPYWPGYHPHNPYPPHYHHPPHHGGGHYAHGPRVSTSRNHDYGRSRIIDRSSRLGEQHSPNRNVHEKRSSGRERYVTDRSGSRKTNVSDRSGNRKPSVTSQSGSNRRESRVVRSSERSNHNVNRNTNRSSNRSSNVNSRPSSSRSSNVGTRGGSMGRSGGGTTSRGGGRGR